MKFRLLVWRDQLTDRMLMFRTRWVDCALFGKHQPKFGTWPRCYVCGKDTRK